MLIAAIAPGSAEIETRRFFLRIEIETRRSLLPGKSRPGGLSYRRKSTCDASKVTICSLSGPTEIIGIGTLRYAAA